MYTTPTIKDYGTVAELTAAAGLFGTEDGASKLLPMHHGLDPLPSSP